MGEYRYKSFIIVRNYTKQEGFIPAAGKSPHTMCTFVANKCIFQKYANNFCKEHKNVHSTLIVTSMC